jgi:demethylmenaquinone methyltransferase / 2-methoxy-6-polyprenyl-1,4-benzoquinol methylase
MSAAHSRKTSKRNPEATWYGFTRIEPGEKAARVRRVFDSVASRYDLMNDLMSGGLHRLWKNRLVAMMRPRAGQKILDVAGGTGDIALRCAEHTEGQAHIVVCDINPAMLQVGRDKAIDHGYLKNVAWVTGDAEALPFSSQSMDTACIAFGLRNVTRIDTALLEMARVLKPGGRFFCLEFSPGVTPWLKELYEHYSFAVLPCLGEHVAGDREAYQYLAESIRKFPDQPTLATRMKKAGLSQVTWQNLTGGIAVVHRGEKI